jgi:hypothetical protein
VSEQDELIAAISEAAIKAHYSRVAGEVQARVLARVAAMDGWSWEQVRAEATRVGEIIAYAGDAIMFPPPPPKGNRKAGLSGPTAVTLTREQADAGMLCRDFTAAELLDALDGAYAVGSLVPGGITWLGLHFCTAPHRGCPAGNLPQEPEEAA